MNTPNLPENPPALRPASPPDSCPQCGKVTEEGKVKWAKSALAHPIYGTNLNRPKWVIIEEVRSRLCAIRGSLSDFASAFPGWRERTDFAEGGITCIIAALAHSVDELRKFEIRQEAQ